MRAWTVLRGLVASAQSCTYYRYYSSYVVADGRSCRSAATACAVNSSCLEVSYRVDTEWPNARAVGDMTYYKPSHLSVTNVETLDISVGSLLTPRTWWITNVSTIMMPSAWPSSLENLYLQNTSLTRIPAGLPSTVQNLGLYINSISDVTSLPSQLGTVDLRFNPIEKLVNLDMTANLSTFNTPITTLSRVYLSDKMKYFACYNCTQLANVTITQSTFNALDRLGLFAYVTATIVRNGIESTQKVPTGFYIDQAFSMDVAPCAAIGGATKELWKAKSSTYTWTVCVLPDEPGASSTPTTATSASSSNTALIAGVAAGVVVVLLGIIGFCIYRRRQRTLKNERAQPEDAATCYFPVLPTPVVSIGTGTGPSTAQDQGSQRGGRIVETGDDVLNMAPLRKFKLEIDDLVTVGSKPIASGAYGDVWRGRYLKEDVAIKRIKHDSTRHIQKFMDEILLLSKMQCSYIVEFVGASWRRPMDLACVVEYMDLGDLRSFLSKTTPDQFTWPQKHMSISSVVLGLLYLHTFETPIIHRDLKSRNVLLDSKKGTKLTDFGESREVDENTLTCGIGTYQWMAPEVIGGSEYTVAADVYSLGVLLTEFSTHLTPYSDMINPHTQKQYNQQYLLTQVASGKIRPTMDLSTTPTWVTDLALQCMATNPDDRPSIMVVAAMVPRVV